MSKPKPTIEPRTAPRMTAREEWLVFVEVESTDVGGVGVELEVLVLTGAAVWFEDVEEVA